jgi:NTP pyrophosphatase (non-canonical NTP hydrolase)
MRRIVTVKGGIMEAKPGEVWEPNIDTQTAVVGTWASRTFPQSTDASRIEHLRREVVELSDALASGRRDAVRDEIADCFLLLFHLCHTNGITPSVVIAEKFAKVQGFTWGEPDEQGVVERAREERA